MSTRKSNKNLTINNKTCCNEKIPCYKRKKKENYGRNHFMNKEDPYLGRMMKGVILAKNDKKVTLHP